MGMLSILLAAHVNRVVIFVAVALAAIALHRRFDVPTLPWIAIYAVLAAPVSFASNMILSRALTTLTLPFSGALSVGETLTFFAACQIHLQNVAHAIIAWCLLAEFANLISLRPESPWPSPSPAILWPRQHALILGGILAAVVFIVPAVRLFLAIGAL